MKPIALSVCLLALSTASMAQEVGRVLSRTPVYQQVAVPRQTCQQTQPAPQPTSGGGAMLGAVVGGLVGNALGGGDSRGIATMAGVIGGAVIGDKTEAQNNNQPVTQCSTQTTYENRLIGYNVVYEYAGKQYQLQMPQDPGNTIPLQITPVPPAPTPMAPLQTQPQTAPAPGLVAPVSTTTVITPAPVVYTAPPVIYAPSPYYYRPWPVMTSVNLGFGWYGGSHHRHWR